VASEPAFVALKLAGAAYLVYLGGRALLAAARRRQDVHEGARPTRGDELRQGLLSNLGNPKMAVFFSSLLPQFGDTFPALLGLGLLFCALTLSWLCGYAFAVARAGDLLRRPRVRRSIDALTGTALVALGLRLATSDR
jgi:threonine/homoserine/homoserine lactone efflux protein